MYNEAEIRARISKKRQRFTVYLVIALAILVGGILLIALDLSDTLFFLGILVSLVSLVYISALFNSYSPRVLFSKAKCGKNIKEDVYEVYVRRGIALRPKQVGMRLGGGIPAMSHTRMAKGSLRSSVYLKLEDGNIHEIRGLRVEHTELFEDGDVLYKHAGTKYPVIISRRSERQPCPICGSINLMSDNECIHCGLQING